MQKTRQREEKENSQDTLEHTVTIGGKPCKVTLNKGERLSDLLKKFILEHPQFNLSGKDIMCNSKIIDQDNGNLKEDPILAHASIVTIAGNISGGIDPR